MKFIVLYSQSVQIMNIRNYEAEQALLFKNIRLIVMM